MELSRRNFIVATAGACLVAPRLLAEDTPKPQFKLGLVTYNVAATWTLAEVLQVCKDVGIAAVECRTTHKHGVEPILTRAERSDVKKRFAEAGVVFWGSGSTCEFHAADPATVKKNIEDCKRFCDLVHDLGGTGVKVRPNGIAKGMSDEAACEQIGTALQRCGQAAADAGVEIWVEVHGNRTQEPKLMHSIMTHCGHKAVGITWNSNTTDVADGSIDASFDLLKDWIKSCHITDLTKDKAGTYPYRDLFKKLTANKYDRYTLCEYPKTFGVEDGTKFLTDYKALWQHLCGLS